jgi:hypothetical protein
VSLQVYFYREANYPGADRRLLHTSDYATTPIGAGEF